MLGLRKNIDYKTAVQLVEHNPVVGGVSYAATQMIRSPLFQRLAAGIDETAKNQTLGSIDERQRLESIQKIAIETGVSKADLTQLMEHIARVQPQQGPPGPQGEPGQPGRVHHARVRAEDQVDHRVEVRDRAQAYAEGRPVASAPRHLKGQGQSRVGAAGDGG